MVAETDAAKGRGPGETVRYDPGQPFTIHGVDNSSYWVGNRFDTSHGEPLDDGTITAVSWFQGAVGSQEVLAIFSTLAAYPIAVNGSWTASTYNAIQFTAPIPVQPPFFVGVFAFRGGATGVGIGVASASFEGQGFHAVQKTFTDSGSVTLPGLNASVRVSGGVAVPVELMEFDVD